MSRQTFYASACENNLSYCGIQQNHRFYGGAASGELSYCALLLSFWTFGYLYHFVVLEHCSYTGFK
jgi:hypothetical protein